MPRQTKRAKFDLRLMYIIIFFHALAITLTEKFLPIYLEVIGISLGSIGLIYAFSVFASGFTRLPIGAIADFYSKKLLIILSLSLVPIYIIGVRMGGTTQHFIWLKILIAVVNAVFWTSLAGLFLDKIKASTVGRDIAMRHIVGAVAGAAAGLGAGFLIDLLGFTNLFSFALIVSFVPILLSLFLKENGQSRKMPSFKEAREEYRQILSTKGFLVLLAFGLIISAVNIIWVVYTPIYLSNNIGLSTSFIGILFAVTEMGKIISHYPRGKMTDKFHAKWLIVPGFFLMWVSGYIFLQLKDFIGLVISRTFVWVGADLVWQPSLVRVSEMAPAKMHAGANALYHSVAHIGMGLAALVGAYMVETIGIRATMLYFINTLLIFGALSLFFHKYMRWKYGYYYKRHHIHIKPLFDSEH